MEHGWVSICCIVPSLGWERWKGRGHGDQRAGGEAGDGSRQSCPADPWAEGRFQNPVQPQDEKERKRLRMEVLAILRLLPGVSESLNSESHGVEQIG